jgi:hypothetical protein
MLLDFGNALYRYEGGKMSDQTLVQILTESEEEIIDKSLRWAINLIPQRYRKQFVDNFKKGPYIIRYYRDAEMIKEDIVDPQANSNDFESEEFKAHIFDIVRSAIKKY